MTSSLPFLTPLLVLFTLGSRAFALDYNKTLNSQVRSAYHGFDGMTVSWNTYQWLPNPSVVFGTSPSNLNLIASSSDSSTYDTSLTFNNHVVIEGLQPGTQYYFLPTHLLNASDQLEPFTFTTARSAGDLTPYAFALVGDMGTMGSDGLTTYAGPGVPIQTILRSGEHNTMNSLADSFETFDFVFHAGDFAYADYWSKESGSGFLNATGYNSSQIYEAILDDFYDGLSSITSRRPYMVAPGNHDANCNDGWDAGCSPGQTNFTGFQRHWKMPSDVATQAAGNLGSGNMWYSFDNGMVHYVVYDTETDISDAPDAWFPTGPFGSPGEQLQWIEADLAAVNRSITPWVIAIGHRPFYTEAGSYFVCDACREAFEAIFNRHGVDLVINGHHHLFERYTPMSTGGVKDESGLNDPNSPWYIVNGMGGHYDGLDGVTYLDPRVQYRLDISAATYGWSKLTFHNCTHLTHELIDSATSEVLDSATLFKSHFCLEQESVSGFQGPDALPAAINAPYGYLGWRLFEGEYDPRLCTEACLNQRMSIGNMTQSGCKFVVAYNERHNSTSTGTSCALYSDPWNSTFATNYGQRRGFTDITISQALAYTLSR